MNWKRHWRSAFILALFCSTLCAIGRQALTEHLESAARGGAPQAAEAYETRLALDLGTVEARDYRRMGSIRAFLEFSPDGALLGAGTDAGEILMIDAAAGRVLWREKIGIGRITALTFSRDGRALYVGESSPEGNLFCLDARTGEKRWQRGAAAEIGADIRRKSLPAVVRIAASADGVYALALRYDRRADGELDYNSRIYALDADGSERWLFPRGENADAWVSWFGLDAAGESLAFGTANFSAGTYRYDKNLYFLDARRGALRWDAAIAPLPEGKRTVMRGSPNVSDDGQLVAALASDGRAFVYSGAGELCWTHAISAPQRVRGVYVNAVGRDAYIVGDTVVFATLNTYNSANWQLPTPVEHPASNNVVLFDRDGTFKARWQAGGSVEEMSFAAPYAAAAIGRNTKTKDASVHGLYVLGLEDAAVAGRIPTEGPAVAAALAREGRYAAVVEVPLKLDDGRIVGSYKLTFAMRKE